MHASLQTVEGKTVINPMSLSTFCLVCQIVGIELPCMREEKLGKAVALFKNCKEDSLV